MRSISGLHLRTDLSMFGRVPDPPEPLECYGYWDNPDNFNREDCRYCSSYDECLREYESEEEL